MSVIPTARFDKEVVIIWNTPNQEFIQNENNFTVEIYLKDETKLTYLVNKDIRDN